MISTALKRGVADAELVAIAVELMTTTNAAAAEAMLEAGVEAATDVTGFGLLGHLHKMLFGERLRGARRRGGRSADPGGARTRPRRRGAGRDAAQPRVRGPSTDWGELTPPEQLLLADAQTCGGLLVTTQDPCALATSGLYTRVGEVVEGGPGAIARRRPPGGTPRSLESPTHS